MEFQFYQNGCFGHFDLSELTSLVWINIYQAYYEIFCYHYFLAILACVILMTCEIPLTAIGPDGYSLFGHSYQGLWLVD
jgi:hypothetical protein